MLFAMLLLLLLLLNMKTIKKDEKSFFVFVTIIHRTIGSSHEQACHHLDTKDLQGGWCRSVSFKVQFQFD